MKLKRRHLALSILPALLLTGCFDLGTLNDEDQDFQKYYDTFNDVYGIFYKEGASYDYIAYDLEDSLCNEDTINDFKWEDGKDVKEKEYLYIVIQPKEAIKIEEIVIYFKSQVESNVSLSCFYYPTADAAPKDPRFRQSDPEGTYDDPVDGTTSVLNYSVKLKENEWKGFMLENFVQGEHRDKCVHMDAYSELWIRINNNSGYYEALTACNFTFIDLIMRAVE